MKKQQKITLAIDGDYADLILPELSYKLWNKFRIRTKVIDRGFEDDTIRNVDVLFMGSDEAAWKIMAMVKDEYELQK